MSTKDNQIKLIDFASIDVKAEENEALKDKFIEFLDIESSLFYDAIIYDTYNDEYYICNESDPLPYSKNGFNRILVGNEIVFKNLDNGNEYISHIDCNIENFDDYTMEDLEVGFNKGNTLSKENITRFIEISKELKDMDKNIVVHQFIDFMDEYDFYNLRDNDYSSYASMYDEVKNNIDDISGITDIINYLKEFKNDGNGIAEELQFEFQRLRNEMVPFEVIVNDKVYYLEVIQNNSAFYFDDFSEKIVEINLEEYDSKRNFTPMSEKDSEKTKIDLYKKFKESPNDFSYTSESFLKNKQLQNTNNQKEKRDENIR